MKCAVKSKLPGDFDTEIYVGKKLRIDERNETL